MILRVKELMEPESSCTLFAPGVLSLRLRSCELVESQYSRTMSSEDFGLSTGRWTKKQIWEYRQRQLHRRRKERMEDYASGLPRDPDEEDWLEYMAGKEESKTRSTEPMDTGAFTVGKP